MKLLNILGYVDVSFSFQHPPRSQSNAPYNRIDTSPKGRVVEGFSIASLTVRKFLTDCTGSGIKWNSTQTSISKVQKSDPVVDWRTQSANPSMYKFHDHSPVCYHI